MDNKGFVAVVALLVMSLLTLLGMAIKVHSWREVAE